MKRWLLCSCLLLAISISGCKKSTRSVRIDLPLPPKLDLTNYDYVYFPGFITDVQNESFDTDRETVNFFKREFLRKKIIDVIDNDPSDMSDKDPRSFFQREQPFFKTFNFENSESSLAVTGRRFL